MHWLAALVMALIYLHNIPVTAAIVATEGGWAASFRPFSPMAAVKAARKNIDAKRRPGTEGKKDKKEKNEKGLSRLMLPLRTLPAAAQLLPYVSLEHFHINACIGLDDAAVTALVCGFLTSAGHMILCRAGDGGQVDVRPEFNAPCLRGEICAVMRVSTGSAMNAVARVAASEAGDAPVLRFFRAYGKITKSMGVMRIWRRHAGNNTTDGG